MRPGCRCAASLAPIEHSPRAPPPPAQTTVTGGACPMCAWTAAPRRRHAASWCRSSTTQVCMHPRLTCAAALPGPHPPSPPAACRHSLGQSPACLAPPAAADGGAFLFLLSIRAGGVGLNLQAADTVIMYDTGDQTEVRSNTPYRAGAQEGQTCKQCRSHRTDRHVAVLGCFEPPLAPALLLLSRPLTHSQTGTPRWTFRRRRAPTASARSDRWAGGGARWAGGGGAVDAPAARSSPRLSRRTASSIRSLC